MVITAFLFSNILPTLGVFYICKVVFRLARGHGVVKAFL